MLGVCHSFRFARRFGAALGDNHGTYIGMVVALASAHADSHIVQ